MFKIAHIADLTSRTCARVRFISSIIALPLLLRLAQRFFMNKFRKLGFIEYNGRLEVHNSLLNVILYDKPAIETRDASN